MTFQYFTISIVSEFLSASCAGVAQNANNENRQPKHIMCISNEDVEPIFHNGPN